MTFAKSLTLSWRTSLWYRTQFIDLICKSMGSFLYDRDLRPERVKWKHGVHRVKYEILSVIYSLIWIGRGSCSEVFCIKGVLEKFAKFSGKHLCQSLFLNKVAGLRPAISLKKDSDAGKKKRLCFIKKRLCFPVNFVRFLRTSLFSEDLRWLLLGWLLNYSDDSVSEKAFKNGTSKIYGRQSLKKLYVQVIWSV